MRNQIKATVQYVLFALLFTASSFFVSQSALRYASVSMTAESAPTAAEQPSPQIIIDPGHGGEDGGASSGSILEKDLNLMISENICDIFTIFGYSVQPTRTEDTLLYNYYGDLSDYTGKKKTYDLRNRLRIAEESGASMYLGIHINKFSQPKYKGLQVYYSSNSEGSKRAAELIQSRTKSYLAPDNDRSVKKATSSIYILNRIRIPAVLVECGFISNPDELALLSSPEYRKQISAVIFSGAAEYIAADG